MKLSEFSTEKATDVLCELTPYVTNILSDVELLAELKSALDVKESTTVAERFAMVGNKIAKIIPIILRGRKEDIFGIIGVLNEKSVEQIKAQNIIVTMKQIRDISKDKELLDFFKSCTDTEESE